MIATPKAIILGIIARAINPFIKVHKKTWVFASNGGRTFGEGSKNLMQYTMGFDKSIDCTYITRNKTVYNQLKVNSIKCELNWSIKGILAIAKADCIFFTHGPADIYYAFKKDNRCFYYLTHGQAYKVALNSLAEKENKKIRIPEKIKGVLRRYLFDLPSHNDSAFVSCCSDFISQFTRKEFNPECEIIVLGSPRNDILFTPQLLHDDFFDMFKRKKIITYMPTHRAYGKGKPSPTLFIHDEEKQKWLREHDVVVLIKQHPNMISQIIDSESNDVVIDVTKKELDPQCVMINSDVMITDYSSVWMDWLLLRRPLLHYFYDNFADEDAGYYYDLHDAPAGRICESEDELFDAIKQCIIQPKTMLPSEQIVEKYHKYVDGDACKRHFDKIVSRYEQCNS